jgi:hypothetical protein
MKQIAKTHLTIGICRAVHGTLFDLPVLYKVLNIAEINACILVNDIKQ